MDFVELVALALLVLIAECLMDGTWVGDALLRALDRATRILKTNDEIFIRSICGFFFVALWSTEGILLTPELKTTSEMVP
jgi:hypothetical protein